MGGICKTSLGIGGVAAGATVWAPSWDRNFEFWASGKQNWRVRIAEMSGSGRIRRPTWPKAPYDMNDPTLPPRSTAAAEPEIEVLARETGVPVDTVQEIYRVELDKLANSARIKTYVSVLAHRRVKALLQVEHGKQH
jgi:hypothetical protein